MKIILKVALLCIMFASIFACNNIGNEEMDSSLPLSQKGTNINRDLEILTSKQDLNAMLSRSDEGIVDWELSKEFAELALQDFIIDGEYSESSTLWELPIAIYDKDGSIRYYEFRVINGGVTIAAIVGNAREDLGGPISFVFEMNGYTDELDELYKSGALDINDLPRIVDNDYPNYAIATVSSSRSGDVTLEDVYNPETGTAIDTLEEVLTSKELLDMNPDFFSSEQVQASELVIENYKNEVGSLWEMAKANKGSLAGFAFRGSKKSPRKSVSSSKITATTNYASKVPNRIYSAGTYYWCGPTAAGFMLDFIHINGIQTGII